VSFKATKIAVLALAVALVVMAIYGVQLLRRAQHVPAGSEAPRIAPPTAAATTGNVVLMMASDADGKIHRHEVRAELPQDRGQVAHELMRLLLAAYAEKGSNHPLPKDAEVRQVFLLGTDTVVLDMNAAFAGGHPAGLRAEKLTVESITKTLAANLPGVRRVKILVEGEERATLAGHLDLENFFEAK
jgi:spore germination protein GerM